MKKAVLLSVIGHSLLLFLICGWSIFAGKPSRLQGYPKKISATLVQSSPDLAKQSVRTPRQQQSRPQPPQPKKTIPQKTEPPRSKPAATSESSEAPQPEGSTVSTDDQSFPFPQYLAMIQSRVEREWQKPRKPTAGMRCVVNFEIDRYGNSGKLNLQISSDDREFDFSAMQAVERAAPFPPLPPAYSQPVLNVHFEFIARD